MPDVNGCTILAERLLNNLYGPINAGALVNGDTIAYDQADSLPETVTYYHVETEGHEVILANGVPAETYVDHVGRRAFDNHAEYVALYGDEPQIEEMDMVRISAARLVPAEIKARIDARRPGAAA